VDEAQYRKAIREALGTLSSGVESALRRELARPIDLGHSGRLQFEVCPFFHGIHLVQPEEGVLADSAAEDSVPRELYEAAEAAGFDLHAAVEGELLPWFADRWEAVGGPTHYRPAYAFFHGGLDEPRYDLEQRRWLSVEEVFGE
jgi:hypothetical protein